jgi:threonine dehydrogenase-like Zn-dependent dehydrogenase
MGIQTVLGHEPAGVVVEVGAEIDWIEPGEHVVVGVMSFADGIVGNGGAQGGFSEHLLVKDAVEGRQLKVIPRHVPFTVACLNEPMAVARHGVNQTRPQPGAKVAIFGAGPIGLGALLGYQAAGAGHVVVIDVLGTRLDKALEMGADAVINSAEEDVFARLTELHGVAPVGFVIGDRPDTDIYYDAAGVPAVIATATSCAKNGATIGVVAVYKKPVELHLGDLLATELNLVLSMGYPTEIFQVTDDIVAHWEKYAVIVSDVFPKSRVLEALDFAATPGAADKVVVSLEETAPTDHPGIVWHG